MTCRARDKKIPNFFFIRSVIELLSATEKLRRKTRKEKTYRLFLRRRRHPLAVLVGIAFCFVFCCAEQCHR